MVLYSGLARSLLENYDLEIQRVTSPGGNLVHSLKRTSGGKFEFEAPRSGIDNFCFRNPLASPVTVAFYLHFGHIPDENDVARNEHFNSIRGKIAELRESLESVIAEQKYLKACDARHLYTSESTRKRVILYSLVKYFFLAASSVLQLCTFAVCSARQLLTTESNL
ncbi:hypothetical protein CRYUN_Cryun01aG0168200 [Craigia yunnanensis]